MALGSFGGAFAKAFMSTYQALGEEEDREQAREERRQRMERERAGREAAKETLGRAGTQSEFTPAIQTAAQVGPQQARAIQAGTGDVEFDRAVAQSATDVLRENAMRRGAIPTTTDKTAPLEAQTYTERQAFEDYSRRMAGIDPEKALTARVQGLQLEKLTREADNMRQFDTMRGELNNTLARISGTAEARGLQGLAEEAKKAGLKVEYRAGKDGVGSRVAVLGPKGDVLETITDVNKAVDKLQGLVMQDFEQRAVGLLGTPEAVLAQLRGQRKDAGEALKNTAIANYYTANAQKLATDAAQSAEARAAVKPIMDKYNTLTPEQQEGPEGQKLLNQAAAAAARKTGDFKAAASLTAAGRAEEAYSKAAAEAAKNGMPMPNRDEIYAGYGFAPTAVEAALRSGVNPKTNKPWTPADIAAFKKRYPNTPIPEEMSGAPAAPAAPAGTRPGSAIPTSARQTPSDVIRAARGLPERIPEPPPKEITRSKGRGGGTIREPNPAYAEWEQEYGERYRAQQR